MKALSTYWREWYNQAVPFIKTKAIFATEQSFSDGWNNSKVPLGEGQFNELVKNALSQPDPPWFDDFFFPEVGKRLLKVCMALQEYHGKDPFFLGCRKAADAVGISFPDANGLLQRLTRLKIIRREVIGLYQGDASTWRFLGYNRERRDENVSAVS